MMMPEYAGIGEAKRLPKSGPDRVRACVWYSEALDRGLDHDSALREVSRLFWMFYAYKDMGILENLGPTVAGIPIEFAGEE